MCTRCNDFQSLQSFLSFFVTFLLVHVMLIEYFTVCVRLFHYKLSRCHTDQ